MKKFMKAIAFVTVMCMALSTVAFAAGTAIDDNYDKVIDITVTGATGAEPVALYIVEKDAALTADPLFIEQTNAVDGTATFAATIGADVEAVDVYVGYATYADVNGKAEKLGTVDLVAPITEVTITKTSSQILQENLKAEEQTGAGVSITFGVEAPEGATATDMIWAIRFNDAEGNPKVKYSDPIDVTEYGIGSALKGSITLGLAFLNGSDLHEIDPVAITAVDAIFLFTDGSEVLTNDDDAANKKLTN